MTNPLIIVTGKNGQLGDAVESISSKFSTSFNFLFTDRHQLDLSQTETIAPFFDKYRPQYFINCAAYTAVDKAETEKELAYTINATAVGLIAKECAKINCRFITVSTDYVFDGTSSNPYTESDSANPLNEYGFTKLKGEQLAVQNNPQTIIIRTSWVYSAHGNNFVKTMLRLMKEREEIKVVNDQIGSPTYARDLAEAIMQIINYLSSANNHLSTNIYHFSNDGIISWYDFAVAIQSLSGSNCRVLPIPSSAYPTPAKRAMYSVMDKQNFIHQFHIPLKDWKESLKECLKELGYL